MPHSKIVQRTVVASYILRDKLPAPLLSAEPDFLPNLEILVLVGCIPQENCTPLHKGGDLSPPRGPRGADPSTRGSGGQWSPSGGFGGSAPKAKIDVKFPCKSILISIQYGPFIRQMI